MSSIKVWSKFSAVKSDGKVVKLRIQDIPCDRYQDVADFNMEHFVKYEMFHVAAGIHKNPEAFQECHRFVSEMMKDPSFHITICCLDDTDTVGEIIGVSSMSLTTKDEDFDLDDLELKTKEFKQFFDFMEVTHTQYDVMEKQNVELTYDGRGIAVHPDYRGLGIATEFCKVRVSVCREQGVPLTWAWMTALGSQKAAERAGWETVFQVPYADLEKQLGVSFEGAPVYSKIMLCRI